MVFHWSSVFAGLVALAATMSRFTPTEAHSWIDCIDTDRKVVYDNARDWIYGGETSGGKCGGYINNYPGRGDPNINTKLTYKILMDDVLNGAPPCADFSDATAYSKGFKRLTVNASEKFYYAYLDNGHTSKDKAGRGTFYGVYWTGQPGTSLSSTTELTDDKLIDGTLHDFDDKNCGQTYEDGDFSGKILSGRAGNDYPCVGDLTIPKGTKPGVYNLIWFWRFYNEKVNADVMTTGGHYGGAAYSSCFQVQVTKEGNGDDAIESEATLAPTPAPTPSVSSESSVTLSPEPSVPLTPTPAPGVTLPVVENAVAFVTAYGTEQTPAPETTLGVQKPAETPKPSSDAAASNNEQNQQTPMKGCGVKESEPQGYLRN